MSTLTIQIGNSTAGSALSGAGLALLQRWRLVASEEQPVEPRSAVLSFEDARDIAAGLNGDGEAFARLVRRYQDEIARYMWRFSRDRGIREELVQDVFVEAYFSLGRFQGRAPLLHWLRRIATRVGYRWWKARAQLPPASAAKSLCAAPSELDPAEAAEAFHALLAQLPPRDRLVLTLMYLEDLSIAEIAELTGWTKTLVKVQAHRARGRLKRILEQERAT